MGNKPKKHFSVQLILREISKMASPTNKSGRNTGFGTNGSANDKGAGSIDRETKCPLLLRVFCASSRHNSLSDYNKGKVPTNELQIYTWMDATLKELTSLVKEVNPDARRKGTLFDFAIVYHDVRAPTCRMRDIGTTCAGRKSNDDAVTLGSKKFSIGDYLDIAISQPGSGRDRGPP